MWMGSVPKLWQIKHISHTRGQVVSQRDSTPTRQGVQLQAHRKLQKPSKQIGSSICDRVDERDQRSYRKHVCNQILWSIHGVVDCKQRILARCSNCGQIFSERIRVGRCFLICFALNVFHEYWFFFQPLFAWVTSH